MFNVICGILSHTQKAILCDTKIKNVILFFVLFQINESSCVLLPSVRSSWPLL